MPITIYGIKNCDTMKKARGLFVRRASNYFALILSSALPA
jgi:arsenate reductase-like glutaredoxin family protein